MDVREKLVELLDDIQVRGEDFTDYEIYGMRVPDTVSNEDVADHLIAHGVTVQEFGHWKDDHGDYVCSCCHTAFTDDLVWLVRGESNEPSYCPSCGAKMMPQPPKGE